MCPFDARSERRRARRLPIGCQARIKSLATGDVFYGECVDLSVDGIAIRSACVPQFGERFLVTVRVPPVGALPSRPFVVEAQVCRCQEVERGKCYDIGMAILRRKP